MAVEAGHGFILTGHVTPANCSDTNEMKRLVRSARLPKKSRVYADKGFCSQANRDALRKRQLKNGIMNSYGPGYQPFIPPGATTEPRIIRIIDGGYNLQFTVEDGGCITLDGKEYQLEYLDETHFRAKGGRCWHICEFGQRVIDQGREVRKV